MSRLLSRLLLLSLLAAARPALAEPTPSPLPAPVRIATEGGHPPFNYVEDGKPAGFEVELAQALCQEAELTCTIVLHQWDGIIKGLEAGEYDAIMASMAITPKRAARIAFTKPYYRIPFAYVARRDTALPAPSPATLRGRAVGVAAHGPQVAYLEQRVPGADIRTFDSLADATLDLRAGRVDVVLGDKLDLATFLGKPEGGACCRFAGDVPAGEPLLGEGVGIGLRKGDRDLREAFERALAALVADGRYDRIRAKFIPFDTK
ncbi:transporter substrate-binding domain-containing protein [Methylobacterium nonmethylotrophicum]|uniref:Transporter substrate-binding domain-containing protein n=1 Tax=Methylobacterium nonmethylotrophicum TaxID=1141884 RepID=A0A4Z0NQS2_9HYPH|nr:transporter substrate-binding domain-containing protein [Methylobacterium nonmethylotrophicum]TGD99364.1 transporter substrate-binding domain-containing protein [Methylobacterium nonmethylotrophicum]